MITRDAAHRYRMGQGEWVPGVTSIIETGLGAPFAVASRYGANQTGEAAIELLQSGALQAMLESLGPAGAAKALAEAGTKKRDDAGKLGTDIHALADLVVRGQPTPAIPETYRKRVLDYAEWWKASGWKLRLSEAMVMRPPTDDQPLGWGGTFDLLCFDPDGKTILADVKTGRLLPKAIIQLAGYSLATLVQPATDDLSKPPVTYPMPPIDRYVILHVTVDGVREVEVNIGTAERMAFLACLELHHWVESMKGKRL